MIRMESYKKQYTRQWIDKITSHCHNTSRYHLSYKSRNMHPTEIEIACRYLRRWNGFKVVIKSKILTGYTIGPIRDIDITIYM